MKRSLSILAFAALWQLFAGAAQIPARDEPPMILGMSTALTGPLATMGQQVRQGVEVGIDEVNKDSDLPGRPWRLSALDDAYDPTRTAINMRVLVDKEKALAIIGNLGTPTAVVTLPIVQETRTLLFAPVTGSAVLRRNPPDRYVINLRAGYEDEIRSMIEALLRHAGLSPDEIGFFTQLDAFGDGGFTIGLEELKRRKLSGELRVLHLRYVRDTTAVEGAVARLLSDPRPPRAIIIVGTHAAAAKFIRLTRSSGLATLFLAVSFADSDQLGKALGEGISRVLVSQVLPDPKGETPLARRFREALSQAQPEAPPTYAAFEGYAMVQVLAQALNRFEGRLGREPLIDALERLGDFDIGTGTLMHLSASDHLGSHRVWPTVLRQGRFEPCEWTELERWRGKGL